MTHRAQELMIGRLDTMRQRGHDPTEILNRSTMNNWKDIYEPKGPSHDNRHPSPTTRFDPRPRIACRFPVLSESPQARDRLDGPFCLAAFNSPEALRARTPGSLGAGERSLPGPSSADIRPTRCCEHSRSGSSEARSSPLPADIVGLVKRGGAGARERRKFTIAVSKKEAELPHTRRVEVAEGIRGGNRRKPSGEQASRKLTWPRNIRLRGRIKALEAEIRKLSTLLTENPRREGLRAPQAHRGGSYPQDHRGHAGWRC